jgi:hypothetical protein
MKPRKSERVTYLRRPHVKFDVTEDYFPGYITKLFRDIARRDSLAVAREQARREAETLERMNRETDALADSLMNLPPKDSLAAGADSLGITSPLDSAGTASPLAPSDSLNVSEPPVVTPLTPEQIKAQKKAAREAEKERIRAEKQAAREAKWAEADRKYQERQAAKAQKKLERERAKKLKELRRLEKKAQKERKRLEKYLERERRRQAKKQSKAISTDSTELNTETDINIDINTESNE